MRIGWAYTLGLPGFLFSLGTRSALLHTIVDLVWHFFKRRSLLSSSPMAGNSRQVLVHAAIREMLDLFLASSLLYGGWPNLTEFF